ncbi:MAG: 50S ribosomal protein L11 [Minisyncoccia bacterium]
MAKKIIKQLKLQIPAGKATPAPPVGPALGQAGINIGDFVTKFNEKTRDKMGDVLPVIITVFEDRTYDFVVKQPPMTNLIKKALGIESGSGKNTQVKVGKLTRQQMKEVAEKKMADLNTPNIEQAMKIVAGSARSMGVDTEAL